MDDEAIVRRLVKAALEHRGYQVLLAENGLEAVDIFQQRAAEIVGVVLDMAMPVMDGAEALRYIREIRPHVPVLIASGYGERAARERFGDSVIGAFIQKPYTVAQLWGKIKTLLQSSQQPQ